MPVRTTPVVRWSAWTRSNKQLIGEVREPLPVAPGQPERVEHEYVRNGVAQIFLEVEPLTGRCHVEATERRTRQDWARWIEGRWRGDTRRPSGWSWSWTTCTHGIESLYATYEPRHARQLAPTGPLHAEARQLAQHCRNRIERAVRTMPGPPDSKPGRDAT